MLLYLKDIGFFSQSLAGHLEVFSIGKDQDDILQKGD